ncbi:hypothetical protein Z946_3703 [Sulfitobacter noctilucicola]|uniref:Uncharacterized protein n=1 Tax=Sulfitobacter noctilucicola TaxID=1342301 RepID=A0A7W6M7U7_9RHOB|nr:hypothetical protein Z946_3703 [Sulfitobacter noctilucicola]MBB4174045.1 hypothetical protein [Sulfitobacter noctilucicola]
MKGSSRTDARNMFVAGFIGDTNRLEVSVGNIAGGRAL